MSTLKNKKIKDTYEGLLKTSTNLALTGTPTEIQDGTGQSSGVKINNLGDIELNKLKFTKLEDSNAVEINDFLVSSEPFVAASNTKVPTVESVKNYVDDNVTAQDLDFSGNSGTGDVDLDSEVFAITGSNGIATTALDASLIIDGSILETDIATNTTDIANKVSKLGDTMTGDLLMTDVDINITAEDDPNVPQPYPGFKGGGRNIIMQVGDLNASTRQTSFTFGRSNTANNKGSFAVNALNTASGGNSFASGTLTEATGGNSASFNHRTKSSGLMSAAFNNKTEASGQFSASFGTDGLASGTNSLKIGEKGIASGDRSLAGGFQTQASANNSTAIGYESQSLKPNNLAGGFQSTANGDSSALSFGTSTNATGENSVALNKNTVASGSGSFAANTNSQATGANSTAFSNGIASGGSSFAVGAGTQATAYLSAAFGQTNSANGLSTFVSGEGNTIGGQNSSGFGKNNSISGSQSFVIGLDNDITTANSLVLGSDNSTSGFYGNSLVLGQNNQSTERRQLVQGYQNIASQPNQSVLGQYADATTNNSIFVIGVGAGDLDRNNAFEVIDNIKPIVIMQGLANSTSYADDAAAQVGGVPIAGLYRNGNDVKIRLT
tara:strand:- start:574 stop:2403 length:1830 start_codon:yes stop_codon:yes gene_type:complete